MDITPPSYEKTTPKRTPEITKKTHKRLIQERPYQHNQRPKMNFMRNFNRKNTKKSRRAEEVEYPIQIVDIKKRGIHNFVEDSDITDREQGLRMFQQRDTQDNGAQNFNFLVMYTKCKVGEIPNEEKGRKFKKWVETLDGLKEKRFTLLKSFFNNLEAILNEENNNMKDYAETRIKVLKEYCDGQGINIYEDIDTLMEQYWSSRENQRNNGTRRRNPGGAGAIEDESGAGDEIEGQMYNQTAIDEEDPQGHDEANLGQMVTDGMQETGSSPTLEDGDRRKYRHKKEAAGRAVREEYHSSGSRAADKEEMMSEDHLNDDEDEDKYREPEDDYMTSDEKLKQMTVKVERCVNSELGQMIQGFRKKYKDRDMIPKQVVINEINAFLTSIHNLREEIEEIEC